MDKRLEKLEEKNFVIQGDNLSVLKKIPSNSIDLVYIDPPFNTGKTQKRNNREGEYADSFEDFLGFIKPRLLEAHRVLRDNGSLYFHIDYREVHYCKVLLDQIFGRENFMNEIIWSYDYGARSKKRWSAKHDNILFYVKNNKDYVWNYDAMDRIPYMAPGLVGPEKAARGKTPTDVWWQTIVPTNGKEKTGYPTQKPLPILKRIIKVSCPQNGVVLDFFAGSGTTGDAAIQEGRNFILVDQNPQAIQTMKKRFLNMENVDYSEDS